MYKIKYNRKSFDTEFPMDKIVKKGYNERKILQEDINAFDDDVFAGSALDYLYADNNRSKTQGFLKNNGFPTAGDRQFNKEFYGVEEERKHMLDLLKNKTKSILNPKLPDENDRAFLQGLMGDKEGEQNYQKQISDASRALQDLYSAFRGTAFERGLKPAMPISDALHQAKQVTDDKIDERSESGHTAVRNWDIENDIAPYSNDKNVSSSLKNFSYNSGKAMVAYGANKPASTLKTSSSGPDGTWEKRGFWPWQRTYKVNPPKWEPQYWNDGYYTDDNMTYVEGYKESRTNCYAYALNVTLNPKTSKAFGFGGTSDFGLPVGTLSAGALGKSQITPENTVAMVRYDVEELGWSMEKATLSTPVPKGKWKIAIAIDPGHQYHFYRQDADGTWSHKPGKMQATQYDASGNRITNPQTADGDYGSVNYNVFCGYFIIGPN